MLAIVLDPFFRTHGYVKSTIANDEPYFVAKDVADMLGYKNSKKAVIDHCKYAELFNFNESLPSTNSPRGIKVIPEAGLWRLIIKSTLPEAQKIEEWMMKDTVLDSQSASSRTALGFAAIQSLQKNISNSYSNKKSYS